MTPRPPPLRIGVAGFGRLTERHYLPALQQLRKFAVVTCVADRRPDRRELARTKFPAGRVCPDLDALLGEKIDALLVATPPSVHSAAINAAGHHQLPLFLEKPLFPPGESQNFGDAPAPSAPMMINFNRRFWPAYIRLRERLRRRAPGQPVQLRIVLQINPRAWNAVTDYRTKLEEGGIIYDLGSQVVDLATFFTAQKVTRVRTRFRHRQGHNASAIMKMEFVDGSDALCSIAYRSRPIESVVAKSKDDSFTILHPMAGLRVNAPGVLSPAGLFVDGLAVTGHIFARRFSMIGATVCSALRHFFSCVRTGETPHPGWTEAMDNARILEAAWRSQREKCSVKIDTSPALL